VKFNLFIARRYLFSRKNTHAVNIISGISMLVFLLGAAVTLIFLGFLSGLEDLVKGMNSSFDPDIQIAPIHSKVFEPSQKQNLLNIEGVAGVSEILEENVVVKYGEGQELARMKGMDTNSILLQRLDTLVLYGHPVLRFEKRNFAIFGNEIGIKLNINTQNYTRTADLILPRRGQTYNHLNPEQSISQASLLPSAVVMVSKDVSRDYVLVPIDFARELLDYPEKVTSFEIFISSGASVNTVKSKIEALMGTEFEVKTSEQLNEAAYKVFQTEKWITFLLLMFVLIIAAFNAVGALTMLVMEKKNDITILKSMGASSSTIRKIFIRVGMLICFIGSVLGISIGLLFGWIQTSQKILKMENGIVEAWPIKFEWQDVLLVFITVNILGFFISLYPAIKASKLSASQIENK
jgi:lipoprotein-releasing system permease protein